MIFDPETELQLLESQPEWVGIQEKIYSLKYELSKNMMSFEKKPDFFNHKRIEKTKNELKMFENILLFWALNYQKMKNICASLEHQVRASNNGVELLELIDDLRIAHDYERKENIILSEVFIELAKKKELNGNDIKISLTKLKDKTNEYWKFMNSKINNITNE